MATIDWLYDKRTDCWSIQTSMPVGEYLDLVHDAHQNQGALTGQRTVLTTTTAKRIRERMVSDVQQGAVLPPVVIGAVVSRERFEALIPGEPFDVRSILDGKASAQLSIIDGMQRTAALIDAMSIDPMVAERKVRVEFWVTTSVRAMVYRMLVLNTGQVPWTISRQLSVVYAPLLQEVVQQVPELDKLITPDNPGRRVAAGQYQSDSVVELYIAFSLRKVSVDTKEQVSDEFSRLDFVDNVADKDFQDQFYSAFSMLATLDEAFSRFESTEEGRLTKGRHVFDSQPARIGFIVAIGLSVLGRPGADRTPDERQKRIGAVQESHERFIQRLHRMTNEELGDLLRLDVLREVLDRRVGQVGRYERAVFGEAFKVLLEENYEITNMEQCWRAE